MATPKVKNKYRMNETKYNELKQLQKQIMDTRQYLVSCQSCKLDVEQELAKTDDQLESIKNMLIHFAPNG